MTRAGKNKTMSPDDQIIWRKVIGTVNPLKGGSKFTPIAPLSPIFVQIPILEAYNEPNLQKPLTLLRLDQPTHKKITKGKVQLQTRVDLHGLTQEEAYPFLLNFLRHAYANHFRYALIITGKSGGVYRSHGVLKHNVPRWLSTPPFRVYVNAFDDASRQHGGAGAIYVRLRQRNKIT
jgi:DNA-nicking Smr family endonuclease